MEAGDTPLHTAARAGDALECERLIDAGVPVDVRSETLATFEVTPLEVATDAAVVRLLVARGASVHPWVLPRLCTRARNIDAIRALVELGADVNASGGDETGTPLLVALRSALPPERKRALIRELVALGADVNRVDAHGSPPVVHALGAVHALGVLLELRPDLALRDGAGRTPLCCACEDHSLDSVLMLLDAGASPSAPSRGGRLPLHAAASPEVADALLRRGAAVDAVDDDGATALHAAASRADREVVRLLLARGASPHARDAAGRTPLDVARSQPLGLKRLVAMYEDVVRQLQEAMAARGGPST